MSEQTPGLTPAVAKLIKANRQHIIESALKLHEHVVTLFLDEVAKDLGFKYNKPWTEVREDIEQSLVNAGALRPR